MLKERKNLVKKYVIRYNNLLTNDNKKNLKKLKIVVGLKVLRKFFRF